MRNARPNISLLIVSVLFTLITAGMLVAVRPPTHALPLRFALLGLGISLGPCLAAYALVPLRQKQNTRRIVLLAGGVTILGFSLLASANLDLEGFLLLLFEGVAGAAIGHTIITLILGPALFGRFLCGWGCWRAMVLELLPVGRVQGKRRALSRVLPFGSLALCIVAAAVAFFVFGHHAGGTPGSHHQAGTAALLVGFALYYAAAIGLAFASRDQRAFCKYLCPNLPVLRLTSRLALLKITPRADLCTSCGACTRVCPMDIDVSTLATLGKRIGTGECILCQRCTQVCPTGALKTAIRIR
jgi:ferredoxin-type protein NapH